MRQIVLDVETTGLEVAAGHRLIEIGCVEIFNRRPTGQKFHKYLNPEREIDAGALAVHGIEMSRLLDAPKFSDIADELIAFLTGAELIIHNAPFDVGFLDAELARLGREIRCITGFCRVLDTLALARKLHPGQRNSLDALCKRYSVDNSKREMHGALLDAGILVDIYLAMTGGQSALALDVSAGSSAAVAAIAARSAIRAPGMTFVVPRADDGEATRHESMLDLIHKASGGKALWRGIPLTDASIGDQTHKNQ
jgi:DNA polymerase-3 subunit epsilon